MILGVAWLLLVLAGACAGERWRWVDDDAGAGAASVRIDTKVRFLDDESRRYNNYIDDYQQFRQNRVQADEIKEPTDTDGFYNRPTAGAGSGRYPVRSEPHRQRLISATEDQNFRKYQESDGTLDSFQYCKCVSTPECTPRTDLPQACASGMFLCCYKRPTKNGKKIEIFNELDEDRPMLLPNQERGGAFAENQFSDDQASLPAGSFGPSRKVGPNLPLHQRPTLIGPDGATGLIGPNIHNPTLIGPGGPSRVIGPVHRDNRILIGPGGPSGEIGPDRRNPGVLAGPSGPTGQIGPVAALNPGVLVGPEGPTGQIGPEETAQRPVLVGPGGPTGILGPQQYGQRQVLIGPGGPTGLIGPRARGRHPVLIGPDGSTGMIGPYDYRGDRVAQPGLLVGPGGPTGVIGPGRRLLVGPGGPTGQIGPRGYGYRPRPRANPRACCNGPCNPCKSRECSCAN